MTHAKGAQSGLYAAMLAADGFTGIEDIFEEKYGGFCSTFSHSTDDFDLPVLVDGLGKRWETTRFTIKPYACKTPNHAAVDAIDDLVKEQNLKAEHVEAISVGVPQQVVLQCGWHPYVPKGLTAAQMHTGFCIALRLIEGDVFVEQMVEQNIGRADLVELANRVRNVRSIEREQKTAQDYDYRYGADVEVTLKNGRILKKTVDFPTGGCRRPLSSEQMTRKFRRLAAAALGANEITQLEKSVWGLERFSTVTPLIRALRGHAGANAA